MSEFVGQLHQIRVVVPDEVANAKAARWLAFHADARGVEKAETLELLRMVGLVEPAAVAPEPAPVRAVKPGSRSVRFGHGRDPHTGRLSAPPAGPWPTDGGRTVTDPAAGRTGAVTGDRDETGGAA